ncbi:MAG: acyltransferase family protein [Nitrososphaeraceae archaeon]|nr:acyltransferase family protein [Nitrososphaeraceae archaeon]
MQNKVYRIHGMDALRGIAMWLGVVLHAVMSYQVDPRAGWPKDIMSSPAMDWIYHYLHSFRMPMFFVVAGFFSSFLLKKIGLKAFIKHRFKRIVLPFLLSIIIIVPICGFVFSIYRNLILNDEQLGWTNVLMGSLNWTGFYHIWFLYYLIIFYVAYLSIRRVTENLSINKINEISEIKYFLTALILIAIQYFFFQGQVEPWTGIVPKIGQLLYFGYFFAIGVFIDANHKFLFTNQYLRYSYILIGLILLYFTHLYGEQLNYGLYSVLISMQTVFFVLGHIAIFMNLFNRESRFLRYFSDSSYWFYLIHFPIVVTLQIVLLDVNVNLWLKFIFIIVFTTAFSTVTYHLFVRFTWIGTLLNGVRVKNKKLHLSSQ